MNNTANKVLATLTVFVGGLGSVLGLLAAFSVDLSKAQDESIIGVAGLALLVAGAWYHPSIPVGKT